MVHPELVFVVLRSQYYGHPCTIVFSAKKSARMVWRLESRYASYYHISFFLRKYILWVLDTNLVINFLSKVADKKLMGKYLSYADRIVNGLFERNLFSFNVIGSSSRSNMDVMDPGKFTFF